MSAIPANCQCGGATGSRGLCLRCGADPVRQRALSNARHSERHLAAALEALKQLDNKADRAFFPSDWAAEGLDDAQHTIAAALRKCQQHVDSLEEDDNQ